MLKGLNITLPRLPKRERKERPPAWSKVAPDVQAADQAKIAKACADLVGVFSLFVLVTVFAGIASDKRTPIPIPHLFEPEANYTIFYLPWMPAFFAGALGVWLFNRHGLRILMSLRWGGKDKAGRTPWTKTAVLFALVAFGALIIVTATKFQDTGRVEDTREAAIIEQRADQGRVALETRLAVVEDDLDDLTAPADDTPNTQQMAARAGEIAWAERIDTARAQRSPQLETIERAMSDARAGDRLRAERGELMAQIAAAPVDAETAATVEVDRGVTEWVTDAFSAVPLWFAIATEFLALIMKLVEVALLRRAQAEWLRARQEDQAPPVVASPAYPAAAPDPIIADGVAGGVDEFDDDEHEDAARRRAEAARERVRQQAAMRAEMGDAQDAPRRARKPLEFEGEMVNDYNDMAAE